MSMPAWARISSTATGSRKFFQQVVAQLPPAWGRGTTHTSSQPYFSAASRSMIMARFRCSQHCAASQMPFSASTGAMPAYTARAASWLESLPMCPPTISLDEQPTTNTSPFFSFASASSSVTACRASCSICF